MHGAVMVLHACGVKTRPNFAGVKIAGALITRWPRKPCDICKRKLAGLSTDAMLMWGFSGRAGGAFSPDAFWCVQEEDEPNLPALSLLRLSMTSALPELQQPTPEIFFHLARLMQPRRKMHLFQQELMPASAIQPMFGTLYYSAPYTNQHHYTTGSIQAIGCFVCFWVHGFTGNRGQGRTRRRIRALSSSRMSLSPSETKLEGGGGR